MSLKRFNIQLSALLSVKFDLTAELETNLHCLLSVCDVFFFFLI